MTLLAAFYVLLNRYTGQHDILVGSPIANRNRVETEGVIGFLLNTLVLRGDVSGDPTFRELLARVREMAPARTPTGAAVRKLVEELQPERDLSRNPIFQMTFVFVQTAPTRSSRSPELTLGQVEVTAGLDKFDFMLGFRRQRRAVQAHLEYNTDLFDDATAERMSTHFETLLEAAVADPGRRVSMLPLLTAAEQLNWSAAGTRRRSTTRATSACTSCSKRRPPRRPPPWPSSHGEATLSYAELDRRANAAGAARCARAASGRTCCVGVMLERSPRWSSRCSRVLKAGGGYVPLDPAYPRDRLAFMLEDAAVPRAADAGAASPRVCRATAAEPSVRGRGCARTSTPPDAGEPDGVATPGGPRLRHLHLGLDRQAEGRSRSRTARWSTSSTSMRRGPALSAERRPARRHHAVVRHRDAGDLAAARRRARRSCSPRATVASDGERLSAALDERGVTVMQATPATWRMLLDAGWKGRARR